MAKLSKEEIKNPDIVTLELKKGFQWTAQHSRIVTAGLVVFAIIGGGYSLYSYMENKKEIQLQEKFFQAEKEYLKKKESFDRYEASTKASIDAKSKEPKKIEGEKPSGNLDQDYGVAVKEFEGLISEAPFSKAARLAALNLGDLQMKYAKLDEAIQTLKRVGGGRDMLAGMVSHQLGLALGNKSDCAGALQAWNEVLNNSQAAFLYADVRLKMGICFESMKDFAKAEENYNKIIAENKDGAISKTAERYLRLMKAKLN